MKTDSNESPKIIVPLGRALKDARLAASFSIDEVAEKLNLRARTVQDLEDDLENVLHTESYPIIYLRGYLANYAKLVGLSTLELFVEYQQLENKNKQKASIKPANFNIPVVKKRSKVLPALLVLIIVIGIVFYFIQSQTSTPPLQVTPNVEFSIEKKSTQEQLTIPASSSDSDIEEDNSETNVPAAAIEKDSQSQPTANSVDGNTELVQSDMLISDENRPTNSEVNNASVNKPATETSLILSELTLAFNAACWTEVFDATGKRIAFGLYDHGRILTLNGVAPFQLKLGDPSVVEIQYKDQIVAGKFTPGRTARFSVPLS